MTQVQEILNSDAYISNQMIGKDEFYYSLSISSIHQNKDIF